MRPWTLHRAVTRQRMSKQTSKAVGDKPSSEHARIGLFEKVGYALGDTASNLYWRTFEVFIVFFYTDVFGLPAATVGTMLLVTRVLDAVFDPVMGVIADRTKTRYGKFRPYLLWFAVPMAISGVVAFSTPNLPLPSRILYAYITYALMMLVYTAVNIPYSALMGVVSSSSKERTSLSTFRFYGGFIGGLFVQTFALKLVRLFGRGNAALGWQLTMGLFGVLAVALFCTSFATTRERVLPPAEQKADVRRDLTDLFHNGPWVVLFFTGIFMVSSFFLRGSVSAYYFKYYLQSACNEGCGGIAACVDGCGQRYIELLSWFFFSGALAGIAGVSLTGPLTARFGKRNTFVGIVLIGGGLASASFFIQQDQVALVFALHILLALVMGPQAALLWAMFADTADFAEWKTGRRNTGLVFAAAVFALKLGGALGGLCLGLLLTYFGYQPNVAQSGSSIFGIRLMMSVIPGLLFVVAAIVACFYTLDDARVRAIETDLRNRRKGSGDPTQEELPLMPAEPCA